MWGYIIVFAIALVASYAVSPKSPAQRQPSVDQLDVPTAEEGKPVPVVFGTVLVTEPNIVWYGDLSYTPIYSESGGK